MEPVAKRTRRQHQRRVVELIERHRELCKSRSRSTPVSPPPANHSVINLDDDDDDEEEGGRSGFVEVEEEAKEEIPMVLSSSESEEEEEELVMKTRSQEKAESLIVIDDDDDEEGEMSGFVGVQEEEIPMVLSCSEGDDDEEFDYSDLVAEEEKEENCKIKSSSVDDDDDDDDESGVERVVKKRGIDCVNVSRSASNRNVGEDEEDGGVNDDQRSRGKKEIDADNEEERVVGTVFKKRGTDYVDGSRSCSNRYVGEDEDDGGVNDDQRSRGKKEIDDDDEEERGVGTVFKKRGRDKGMERRKPLSSDEISRMLLNSIMDVKDGMVEEGVSVDGSEESSSSSELDFEKPDEEVDSMYRLMDFCLACSESDSADPCSDEEDTLSDASKSQEQLCKEGEHLLSLDEEIGIICKSCGLVREEIKHVMPHFHENLFGLSDRRHYSSYDYRNGEDLLHLEDPSCEYQHCQEDANFDPTGTVWEIIPGLRRTLLPHQIEAFEFIWRNVAGGTKLDEIRSDGGGCLISHAPGTGKTRLAIAFLETYMKRYKNSRPVILAPASILLTWKKEFEKWKVGVPFLNLNDEELSEEEITMASSLFPIRNPRSLSLTNKRLIKLSYWKRHESVLAMSYTMLTQLAGGEGMKKRGRTKKHISSASQCTDERFREMLLDLPGLLILDEGHMPRNDNSYMFKVVCDVRTKKRVNLSGTPFQNNFHELYNTLSLVRREFIWAKNPFKSTVDKADGDKIRALKAKMERFSHCYDGSIVHKMVPGLNDNVVFLDPSTLQKSLLQKELGLDRNHFEANVCASLISVHPLLLDYKNTNPDYGKELKRRKWDLCEGAKARFLIRLIELSSALGERVLVFSEYLPPLYFLKAVLESSDYFGWKEGREVFLMSGSQDMKSRKKSMDLFNKAGSEAKVMLASIKASSEGIELTGASRVVLLDVTWNPAVEKQAMSRAYRIGQEKVVHVYHLIMTDHDSNRHLSQTQKNKCARYVFSSERGKKNDVAGSSKAASAGASEDMILERLLEEKVITKAMFLKVSQPGLDNGS